VSAVDDYRRNVIKLGDKGSEYLAKRTADTLKDRDFVDVLDPGMNGLRVLRIPKEYVVIVHSASGEPRIDKPEEYAASLIKKLVEQSERIGATPVGVADVVDVVKHDAGLLKALMDGFVDACNKYKIAVMNGEYAILGNRVRSANMCGTMVCIAKKSEFDKKETFSYKGVNYAVFDPDGKPVYMNSDGVGTKTEFHERAKKYGNALSDFLPMNLDDTIKRAALARVASAVVEVSGNPLESIAKRAQAYDDLRALGLHIIVQQEMVGDRVRSYDGIVPGFSISGSVVSTIDEDRLRNPPVPSAGDTIIAVRGPPNPRSNGITDKRRAMIEMFGPRYHKTKEGRLFLEYLAAPSVIFYPVFSELINSGLATAVFHMSGGAYDGKLARPLAKLNLFARLENLFPPDWREQAIVGHMFATPKEAYGKWPMGNDGFITTRKHEEVLRILRRHNLEGSIVGKTEEAKKKTGVEIILPHKKKVYFSGRD